MKKYILLSFIFLLISLSACKNDKNNDFKYSDDGHISNYLGSSDEIFIPSEINGIEMKWVYLPNNTHAKKLYIPSTVEYIFIDLSNIDIDKIYYDGTFNYWYNNVNYHGNTYSFIPSEKMYFKDSNNEYYCLKDKGLILGNHLLKIKNNLNFDVDEIYIDIFFDDFAADLATSSRINHPFEKIYFYGDIKEWCNFVDVGNSHGNFATKEFYTLKDGKYELVDKLVIPEGVEIIEKYQFSHLQYIEEIEIDKGVKFIHPYAFKNCYSIKKVTMPLELKSICDYFDSIYNIEFIFI